MDALTLIQLGRRLTKLGEEALRRADGDPLPNGPALVLRDVATHPGTTVGEIAARTALRQSYVSESVELLFGRRMVTSVVDGRDRRRRRVRIADEYRRRGAGRSVAPAEPVLRAAVGEDALAEVTRALALLVARLPA